MAKALVVDDDHACLMVAKAMLKNDGHEVITLSDGFQVDAVVERELPDIVIIDLFMSGKDGLENIISIRNSQPTLPIVAMSMDVLFLKMATVLGADEAVTKPIHSSNLCDVVSSLVERELD